MRRADGMAAHYERPLWLTEFAIGRWDPPDGPTRDEQDAYMQEVLPLLEANDNIFRYVWYIHLHNISFWFKKRSSTVIVALYRNNWYWWSSSKDDVLWCTETSILLSKRVFLNSEELFEISKTTNTIFASTTSHGELQVVQKKPSKKLPATEPSQTATKPASK